MVRTNLVGTMNLVRSCLRSGFDAFVNTGSSSEYGFKSRPPTEHEYLEPNSYYAVTKASATLFCRYTAQRERVHLPTLRIYSAYGPYEEPGRLMPTLVLHGIDHRLPPLADPDVARDYVYIDDVAEAFVLAASRPLPEAGAVYNVGTGIQTSLREVVGVARRVLGIAAAPAWGTMTKREWDTSVWVANNQHVRSALGWTPRHGFESGFRRMVAWMLERKSTLHYYRARTARRLTNARSPTAAGQARSTGRRGTSLARRRS